MAHKVIEEAEKVQPNASIVLTRKARILHKSDKSAAAIDVLLKLAAAHKAANDRTRLISVYEQILKIDSKRRDVQKALRDLKSTKTKKLTQRLVIGVSVQVVFSGGDVKWVITIAIVWISVVNDIFRNVYVNALNLVDDFDKSFEIHRGIVVEANA